MLLLKSEKSKVSSLSPSSPKTHTAELALWEQLQFSFDMDNEPPRGPHNSSHPRDTRRTRASTTPMGHPAGGPHTTYPVQSDAQDAALLAQFAAAAGMPSHSLSPTNPYGPGPLMPQGGYSHPGPSGFHDHLYNHETMGHTQLPPLSSLDFPWNHFPPQPQPQPPIPQPHQDQYGNLQRTLPNPGIGTYPYGSSSHPPTMSLPESPSTGRPSNRRTTSSNAVASSSTTTAPPPEPQDQGEGVTVTADEKRRRNTAASARFRIKKKQRTVNLERSVSDLTGRAEDLEREAADLRRENGWLKEIVMLKGSRIAGVNLASHILAESAQRAANDQSSTAAGSSNSASRTKTADPGSDDASSEEEDEEEEVKPSKSKKK